MNELVVITPEPTQEYVSLVSHIANLWEDTRNNAITAVNESLLKASWDQQYPATGYSLSSKVFCQRMMCRSR